MKIFDIFLRANKNLFRSKLRTVLTIVAIVIGAFSLNMCLGIGEGVKQMIDNQMNSILTKNLMVIMPKSQMEENPFSVEPKKYNPNTNDGLVMMDQTDIDKIKKIKNVKDVFPMNSVQPKYIASQYTKEKYEIAIMDNKGYKAALIAGENQSENSTGYILLRKKYVSVLGFKDEKDALNKKVKVAYQNMSGEVMEKEYTVKGVASNSFINDGSSYISASDAKEVSDFQTKNTPAYNKYMIILVSYDEKLSKADIENLKSDLAKINLAGLTIEDQSQMIKGVITAVQTGLGVFAALTILASVFGIINTMLMGVYERTQEIGLLKALGTKKSTIFAMFSFEAMGIGFWGGIVGIGLSLLVGTALNNYVISQNLLGLEGQQFFIFPIINNLLVLGGLILISLLAGSLPSRKASNMDPIKALRYE